MFINRLFELAGINLLCEAAYDSMVDSIKKQFPNNIKEIEDNLKWAKDNLTKQDRIVWYLKVLRAFLENNINSVKGNYNFTTIKQFNADLLHYYGYNINQIESSQFTNQNISELFQLFDSYIRKYQASDKAPVPVQHGDYELIKCNDGNSWWFINRSYCQEEGRSGKHCGNVTGKHDTTQRILSLRTPTHNVILTFILLDNGFLGEMKAKANLKPQEKYHPDIMQLLLNPRVKGIKGAGYAPWMNFSIFDLSEDNIKILINHNKQSFIINQIKSEPTEFLKAPNYIKDNPEYQKVAIKSLPALRHLIGNENNLNSWEKTIKENESLIIYAPRELNDFKDRVIDYLKDNPDQLMKTPKYISQDFDINKYLVEYNYENIQYILPNVPKYAELCKLAVSNNILSFRSIPEEHRTSDLCKIAVSNRGYYLQYVPEELKTLELCKIAVSQNGNALSYVPEELKTFELCKIAVTTHATALRYVPKMIKDKIKQEFNIQESVDFKYFQNL